MSKTGYIYRVYSPSRASSYIGSTTYVLPRKRFYTHCAKYKQYLNNRHHYVSVFELFSDGIPNFETIDSITLERDELESEEDFQKRFAVSLRELEQTNIEILKIFEFDLVNIKRASRHVS